MVHIIWKILNSNIGILLIGSSIGWVFLNMIWEPHQEKIKDKAKRKSHHREVLLRLNELNLYFSKKWLGSGMLNLLDGDTTLNPDYKNWKLSTLINMGWKESVYEDTYEEISALQSLSYTNAEITEEERIQKALTIIQRLRQLLKNND